MESVYRVAMGYNVWKGEGAPKFRSRFQTPEMVRFEDVLIRLHMSMQS